MNQPTDTCPHCKLLAELVERQAEQLRLQAAQIGELKQQVRDLKQKLDQNSSNSSRPPSSDSPWQERLAKRRSNRRPGGQPGHPGHSRVPFPPERVDKVVDHIPAKCAACGKDLPPDVARNSKPVVHQVAELPKVAATVTEHRAYACTCAHCGETTRAEIPEDIRAHILGPRLSALMSYLSAVCHTSRRGIKSFVETVLNIRISLGSVAGYEGKMSASLEQPYAAILAQVRSESALNLDETTWRIAGNLRWLWTAAGLYATVFQIHERRDKACLSALVGAFHGTVTSDRFGIYHLFPLSQRQVCWAHLKRDFQKMVERGGLAQKFGNTGLEICAGLFAAWKEFKAARISRAELQQRIEPLRMKLNFALRGGQVADDSKLALFARRLVNLNEALWNFTKVEGVEPTNNHAERALRPGVIWRKVSFGSQSEAGCRFTERLLSVIATLRQQTRPIFDYLVSALSAYRLDQPVTFPVASG